MLHRGRAMRMEFWRGTGLIRFSGQVTTVFPLIITRDDLGSALGTNAFLNLHFQELLKGKRYPRSVTPLFCLSSDDFEKLSAYLPDCAPADVLSARHKRDKMLQSSFWLVENSVLKKKGERKPKELVEASGKLGWMMAERLGLKDAGSISGPTWG